MQRFILLNLLLLVFISACSIDDEVEVQAPCEDVTGDEYELLETSIDQIPYFVLPEDTKFIFRNESMDEVRFRMEERRSNNFSRVLKLNCPSHPDLEYSYTYKTESEMVRLVSDETPVEFNLSLSAQLSFSDPESGLHSDDLSVIRFIEGGGSLGYLKTIDKRNQEFPNHFVDCHESIEVDGIELTNVCHNNFANPVSVFWDQDNVVGIKAFREENDELWVLDRIE